MSTPDMISPHHLARKAIIYIRQSTPNQVISHQESLRLQYALKQRALSLGWDQRNIEIIDTDLGLSGSTSQYREGFKNMLSKVALGEIGIILSYEVTRLSRNCSDWYPLLDICGYKRCLIADNDGIYDPGTPNGRLLLGLKGQISELELYTLRSRLTAGLLNKAKRGELALKLPVGLIRDERGGVLKDPHREVRSRLNLIFTTFMRLKSASKVLQHMNEQNLTIPRRNNFGDLIWKKPTVSAILSILKNPAYAGAFVYGRTVSDKQNDSMGGKSYQKRVPMEQWKIIVKDKYPAYINWDTYEKIQTMIQDNYTEYDRNKSRGIPREGAALLHGIVYCGECGHKMVVQYKNGTRYLCNYLRQQYRVPVCQHIPADPVDQSVTQAFFEALSPIEIDAYNCALEQQQKIEHQNDLAQRQQIERLRYQATLAQRQFDQVDPDNRLVAAELEKRWEHALTELQQAEKAYDTKVKPHNHPALSSELVEAFKSIGQKLPKIWDTPLLSTSKKKSVLRALIDKVVIHRSLRNNVHTRIVWKGGATTTLEVPINVGSFDELPNAKEMEQLILDMATKKIPDTEIAKQLTAKGFRSPMRNYVLPSTVQCIRLKHRKLRKDKQSHPQRVAGFLTVSQIAKRLNVPNYWIYDRIRKGVIQVVKDPGKNIYLFPGNSETLKKFSKLKNGRLKTLQFKNIAPKIIH